MYNSLWRVHIEDRKITKMLIKIDSLNRSLDDALWNYGQELTKGDFQT